MPDSMFALAADGILRENGELLSTVWFMSLRRLTPLLCISSVLTWLALPAAVIAQETQANPDFAAAARTEDTTLDVLANDTPTAGDLTIISATEPKGVNSLTVGSAIVTTDAQARPGKLIVFKPNGFDGHATFSYTIKGSDGVEKTALVTLAPITAKADRAFLGNATLVRIPVLKNDKIEPGATVKITNATKPQRTDIVGDTVIYRPGPDFNGYDSFQYTIRYDTGITSTATVSVFAPGVAFNGPLGANITDSLGNIVGYIRIYATRTGAFSGKIQIGTEVYSILGSLNAKGKFVGTAHSDDNDLLALSLALKDVDGAAELTGTFGGTAEWTVSQKVDTLTSEGLETLEGHYTVELAAAEVPLTSDEGNDEGEFDSDGESQTSGSLPQGIGWMTIDINDEGEATIEGRTGDGRSFSTGAQVAGSDSDPELPFYAAWDDSVLAGTLKIGETVEGDVRWILYPNDEDRYPGGFDVTISATGSFYEEPEDGRRVLANDTSDAGRVTISISGGGADDFSREMRLSEDDDVSPIIEGPDEIEFEIDRDNGIFKGKFRDLDDRERRIKFTGVLIQGESRGVGHFEGDNKTGRVEISVSSESDSGTDIGIDFGDL